MRQSHEEIVILCTMGKQVDEVAYKLERLTNQMEFMMETQNAMKQELFILRNAQITATKNEDNPQPQMQSGVAQTKKKQSPQKVQKMSMSFNSEERPKETQLPPAQKVKEGNAKTLFIGDSISSVVDLDALKEATETEIKHIKAYSSVFDTVSNGAKRPAIFPHKNFTDVIPAALKQDTFKNMIVQCGSVDITNLQTKHDVEKKFDFFHQQTVMSAKNLFFACEDALKNNPGIEQIVVMKQIPRYDRADTDPLSINRHCLRYITTQ